jgi:hypothetical protein
MKKIILFISIIMLITACDQLGFGKSTENLPPTARGQWADSATASDAAGGLFGGNSDDQSPSAAIGAPDVDVCDDSMSAWTTSQPNDGFHHLELKYYDKVYPKTIRIHETFNPGAIDRIELLNNNEYITVWDSKPYDYRKCPMWFETSFNGEFKENITMDMLNFKTDTVKITIDTNKIDGWNEIDAVELIGYDNRWYNFNKSLYVID